MVLSSVPLLPFFPSNNVVLLSLAYIDGEVVEYECVLDEQKGKKVAVNVTGTVYRSSNRVKTIIDLYILL